MATLGSVRLTVSITWTMQRSLRVRVRVRVRCMLATVCKGMRMVVLTFRVKVTGEGKS